MNIIDTLKQNPINTLKWCCIGLFILLLLQTCSKCSNTQNAAFMERGLYITVDSLQTSNKYLQDSILILQGDLQTINQANMDLRNENDHLRGALQQSQLKPVIIYENK